MLLVFDFLSFRLRFHDNSPKPVFVPPFNIERYIREHPVFRYSWLWNLCIDQSSIQVSDSNPGGKYWHWQFFRILSYSLINICIREWIILLFVVLFIVNWVCLKELRERSLVTGINIFSSSICSVFQVIFSHKIYF